MNRNMLATVTASALLVTGCSAVESVSQLDHDGAKSTAEIQLGSLPTALPPLVRAMLANSVEIQGVLPPEKIKHKLVDMVEWGQGVRLGPNLVATAGHVVIDDKGKGIQTLATCGNLTVRTPTTIPTSYVQGDALYGTSLPFEAYKASRGPAGNALETPDLALLRVGQSKQAEAQRPVQLAPAKLAPGADLYTINYEPTANAQQRSPYEAALSASAVAHGLSRPVIFGMIALSQQPDQLIEAVDAQRSYGPENDDRSRAGASGSPVYDRDGQLIGLIVQEFENLTAAELADRTNFRFAGATSGTFDEVLIQPVTGHLLHDFSSGLPNTANC